MEAREGRRVYVTAAPVPPDPTQWTRIGRDEISLCRRVASIDQEICFAARANGSLERIGPADPRHRMALDRSDGRVEVFAPPSNGSAVFDDVVTLRAVDVQGAELARRSFSRPDLYPAMLPYSLYGPASDADTRGFVRVSTAGDRLTFLPLEPSQRAYTLALEPVPTPRPCTRIPEARSLRFRARFTRPIVGGGCAFSDPVVVSEDLFTVQDGRLCQLDEALPQLASAVDRYRAVVPYARAAVQPDGRFCQERIGHRTIDRECAVANTGALNASQ